MSIKICILRESYPNPMRWTDQMTGELKAEFFFYIFFWIGKMKIQRWIKIIYLLFVWLDSMEKIIENYLLKYKILLSH